jgi:hypothetical protein
MSNKQRRNPCLLSLPVVIRQLSFLLTFSFFFFFLFTTIHAIAQNQTTGRIIGTVKDTNGAVIAGAEVTSVSAATGEERKVTTDQTGNFFLPSLSPGEYRITITAEGFEKEAHGVRVFITETATSDTTMKVGSLSEEAVNINPSAPLVQREGAQLGRVVDSRMVSGLPLATRNFTQILGLSPGTSVDLPDNTAVGRNSQNISVNGARSTQNNYQINGVNALSIATNTTTPSLAVPAPETIQEFKVQTSLYDAAFGHSGGGNIQIVTKSGANDTHGAAYEYFRNDALNANNSFLKAAGVKRPVLKRNVFGGLLGGPVQKEKAFFFISYQGTRERNGASPNSLSSSIPIASSCQTPPCLTDDRSEPTLQRAFSHLPSINPIALALLNVKLPNGKFLIPTPQVNGRYSGSAPSRFQEDQFNANVDYRLNEKNWFAVKFFFSNAPTTFALPANGGNVPGFANDQKLNNRIITLQEVHTFSSRLINEARLGYNFIRQDNFAQGPVKDSDVGIRRDNANAFPGLPLIRIDPSAGGVAFGSPTFPDSRNTMPSMTAADTVSITKTQHRLRTGAEIIYYQHNFTSNQNSRGQIDFDNFTDFLSGNTRSSVLGTGISERSLRITDYSLFLQDDWKVSPKVTLTLGLRYELDLPPYDTRGRLATFDPSLYKPRLKLNVGKPVGPPIGGFIQAGNVIAPYAMPELPKAGKRVVNSTDPNNFAPRLGFAYSPLDSGLLVLRGGYGIFYSRVSNLYLFTTAQLAPFYVTARRGDRPPFAEPFSELPSQDKFPAFVEGVDLANHFFDRNLRTPYVHQYNTSVQYAVGANLLLEVAYVGTHGLNLFRVVGINQARLASPEHPIINEVTREVITTNTQANVQERAPFQGVTTNAPSGLNQTTGQSNYNSLQLSLTRRFSQGLQFIASYTYAKSLDNTSSGSGSGVANEVAFIAGNQLDNRANRGVSAFDRTHRFVLSYLWDLPGPSLTARSRAARWLLSNWQVAGIVTAMSGLPIDIVDTLAGSLYGLSGGNSALARPSWALGATRRTATNNIPAGYFFNPYAFVRPFVQNGQPILSSNGSAVAGPVPPGRQLGTDIGNVGRNVLRGPRQSNVDFSIIRRFRIDESRNIEFRAEFFNLFNQVNLANPISNFNAVPQDRIDQTTGQIVGDPGDFGRINSTSNNPRLIQFAMKFSF